MKRNITIMVIMILIALACRKQITSPSITASNNYLVVNGNIYSNDSTVISLSRTVNVDSNVNIKPELGATLSVEGEQGDSYPLVSKNNGDYVSAKLNLSASQKYRLKITTNDGRQYVSDYVPVKNSPAIDSINFERKPGGLQIDVNTHDPANNTHYYRWEYQDTYIIHSKYNSQYIVVNHDAIALRTPDQQIYQCWVSDTSSNIILGSSAKLQSDIISSRQLITIPNGSEKLGIKYSILVRQYALTSDAYNYYTLLQQNTEKLGTIFDPQPSSLTGNIHSLSNKAEPVIGYVTAGSVTQLRIFIVASQVPSWTANDPNEGCQQDTLDYAGIQNLIYTGIQIPISSVEGPSERFMAAFPQCVDCTLRGTNKQPIFWK